ncbi:hypothetical protein [Haladaptatus sp. AB643]|uniref:hypothetical protein n=1 Tax=Haladaptatus sp. AB643 TaxID=2934174 RepID=UPI00209C4B2A|nr:hypothetical protein [Haladaptatus sp. AB643]MCO8244612.1 hypothetical protein [Haladaptatus sp. AB643]
MSEATRAREFNLWANALDVDADDALDEALEKYRARIHQSGSASSKTETDFDT